LIVKPTIIINSRFINLKPIYIMYYKDNYIEIRLGLGLKEIRSLNSTIYNFILSKIDDNGNPTIIDSFTSETGLTSYPVDGDYSLEVYSNTVSNYLVYLSINDTFITEFIKQIKDVICTCKKECDSCYTGKNQKLFNTTFILPNTIKPFSYGEVLITNFYLSNFIQLYFNDTILDKKTELGKEYFNYYINGSTDINSNLFKTVIVGNYYSLFYYYKSLLFLNTEDMGSDIINFYNTTINNFFMFNELTSCLAKYIINVDFNAISLLAFNVENLSDTMNQNNFSRTIKIKASDLSGEGSLIQQLVEYINSLDYNKQSTDSDIWIEYDDEEENIEP